MNLHTSNYVFPIRIDEPTSWDPSISIYIGNPKHKPKPCIQFMIEDKYAVLQDLQYMGTCSVDQELTQGNGTVEMVQGSVKWLFATYSNIRRIEFTDKSYIPVSEKYNMPLPEYYMLVHGATWYQTHFGAKPTKYTKIVLQAYKTFRNQMVSQTSLKLYASPSDHDKKVHEVIRPIILQLKSDLEAQAFFRDLRLRPLTGTTWYIPRRIGEQYDTTIKLTEESVKHGGWMVNQYYYRVPYYHALGK